MYEDKRISIIKDDTSQSRLINLLIHGCKGKAYTLKCKKKKKKKYNFNNKIVVMQRAVISLCTRLTPRHKSVQFKRNNTVKNKKINTPFHNAMFI